VHANSSGYSSVNRLRNLRPDGIRFGAGCELDSAGIHVRLVCIVGDCGRNDSASSLAASAVTLTHRVGTIAIACCKPRKHQLVNVQVDRASHTSPNLGLHNGFQFALASAAWAKWVIVTRSPDRPPGRPMQRNIANVSAGDAERASR
jgi:hypothetical protein